MKTIEVAQPYRDAFVVHQALRNLGFSSDNIFVGCIGADGAKNVLVVSLQEDGKKFYISLANMGDDAVTSEVNTKWAEFASDIASGEYSDEVLTNIVETSSWTLRGSLTLLPAALRQKGFVVRNG